MTITNELIIAVFLFGMCTGMVSVYIVWRIKHAEDE